MRGLAGDGAEVPLAVACPGEGDCPALECGDYGCVEALLSCPEGRRCPVPAGRYCAGVGIVNSWVLPSPVPPPAGRVHRRYVWFMRAECI